MRPDIVEQLRMFKAKDKFPEADWEERGLNPSQSDVRDKMNQEVNNFIDFVESRVKDNSDSLTSEIQTYLDDWDSYDYDSEETEYMVDVMCHIMRLVDVDCNKLLI
jgi:hypothetical protein